MDSILNKIDIGILKCNIHDENKFKIDDYNIYFSRICSIDSSEVLIDKDPTYIFYKHLGYDDELKKENSFLAKNNKWIKLSFEIEDNYIYFFLKDISDIKNLEIQQKKESSIKLKALKYLDLAPFSIVVIDNNKKHLAVNKKLSNITGYEYKKLKSMKLDELIHKDDKNKFNNHIEKVFKTGFDKIVVRYLNSNGDIRFWNIESQIVESDIISIRDDVTNTKLIEDRLKKTKELAIEANNAKSDFLANMSHEIRTPLNSIIGFTDLLLETNLNKNQRIYAENANISGKALLSLINDILDFSKIEAGKLDLEIIRVDIYKLLEDTIDIIKYQALKKGLEIIFNPSIDLPNYIFTDPVRLKQVLINLLNNAVKYTSKGEIELRVEFIKESEGIGRFKFSIRDTGIGISKDVIGKLFKGFSQGDSSTTRKYGGTGLGLAISNKIVEKMGSKISLKSELKKGALFYFDIKAEFENISVANTEILKDYIKNILIIDDNKNNRQILEKRLEKWHINYTSVDNGFSALRLLEEENFDIIVIDYHMPYIDGLEVTELIRKKNLISEGTIIILLHSSHKNDDLTKKCEELGIEFNIQKPLKHNEFYLILSDIKERLSNKSITKKKTYHKTPLKDELKKIDKTILIVEDVILNKVLIKEMIFSFYSGIKIIEAENGKEALEKLNDNFIDLILMDIQMPVMDGIEATKIIRSLENDKKFIPIIAVTAGVSKGQIKNVISSGINDFLSKPIKKDLLKELLDNYLL